MIRITCDRPIVEKPVVVSIAHFCKSFCIDRTQFRAYATTDKHASIISLPEARVKPIQALAPYVSFAKMTALKTLVS